uniref:EF-hand domain-containing protein n=1 Tax=Pyrodinium bahamense TaxID=73915 RepID=A0A7S0B3Q9_9DINO
MTPQTSGGCANFATFYRNAMFRLTGIAEEVFVTVSQPDARRELKTFGNGSLTYPQIGLTVLAQDFHPSVSTDAQCCTPNRWQVVQKTSFWNKRDTSLIFKPEPLPCSREYRVVPSCYFPEDPGMGRLTISFCWSGPQSRILAERVDTSASSEATISSQFKCSGRGAGPLSQQLCFKVRAPTAPVPLTVLLIKAPRESRAWAASDPLHAALRTLFERFDRNGNGVLEPTEMWALLDDIARLTQDASELDEEAREAMFREFDRDGSGTVTFGQFLAQSSSLASAMNVPKADLVNHIQALAGSAPEPAAPHTAAKAQPKPAAKPAARQGRGGAGSTSLPGAARRGRSPGGSSGTGVRAAGSSSGGGTSGRARSPSTGPMSSSGVARDVYVAVAPLRCHAGQYENAEASLASGCRKLPVLSNAAVWSSSFLIEEEDFFLCPFAREGGPACSYEVHVLSPLAGLSVETSPAPAPAAAATRARSPSPRSPAPKRGGRAQATSATFRAAHSTMVSMGDMFAGL